MREIKFRVWHKYEKKWIGLTYWNIVLYGKHFHLENVKGNEILGRDMELVEFTGLKDNTKWEQLTPDEQNIWLDSNKTKEEWEGKEIYEGDIIVSELLGYRGVPICDEYTSLMDFHHAVIEYGAEAKDLEIIGNIYENPELLEENNQ